MKMEQTVCSETSAHKIQTPGNNIYPYNYRFSNLVPVILPTYTTYEDGTYTVFPKRRQIHFRCRVIINKYFSHAPCSSHNSDVCWSHCSSHDNFNDAKATSNAGVTLLKAAVYKETVCFCPMPPPHVLVDFVVLPPGHGSSVTDF